MNYDELAVIAGLMNFLRQLQYVYIEKYPLVKGDWMVDVEKCT